MSDRITYRRLVNLDHYEHLLLEVSKEVQLSDGAEVRELVEQVDKWAGLARKKARLERDLFNVNLELSRAQELAQGEAGEYYAAELKDATVKVERIRHDLDELQEEWSP